MTESVVVHMTEDMFSVKHDLQCWLCNINSAVYYDKLEIFGPCWDCESKIPDKVTRTRSWRR